MADTLVVIADLLKNALNINASKIYLYNQKWKIPTDNGMYLSVSMVSKSLFGSNSATYWDVTLGKYMQVQSQNAQEIVQIDIFSRDASARTNECLIPGALTGYLAEESMQKNAMKWSFIVSSVDMSEEVGTSMLTRFSYRVKVLRMYKQVSEVPYYDKFNVPSDVTVDPGTILPPEIKEEK